MTQNNTKSYEDTFNRLVELDLFKDKSDWVSEIRDDALKSMIDLGFPVNRKGNEDWKYTDIRPIVREAYRSNLELKDPKNRLDDHLIEETINRVLVPESNNGSHMVFVDGQYSERYSSIDSTKDGSVIRHLQHEDQDDKELIHNHMSRYSDYKTNVFTAMNTAFLDQGAIVNVPDKMIVDSLVQIIFITTDNDQKSFTIPRVLIVTGRDSKISVMETYVSIGKVNHFSNAVTEIIVGPGSVLNYFKNQLYNENTYYISSTDVEVNENASFQSMNLDIGADIGRNNLNIRMIGEGASAKINGAYIVSRSQHIDNQVVIDHVVGHNDSKEIYKGILDGKSRSVFHGSIIVREKAAKVNANQVDKNLLLSDEAEADTKPAFWVYCDDVLCGHGAACGQIDEDAIFYLMSRGIPEKEARNILIRAFVSEVVDTISIESVKEHVHGLISDKLNNL